MPAVTAFTVIHMQALTDIYMKRYKFNQNFYKIDKGEELIKTVESIKYKCLICGSTFDWDDNWDDEKKEEVKKEVDEHHNYHIVEL